MLSRRIIRIKAFKELYSRISIGSSNTQLAEKEVLTACSKTKDLYLMMALLPSAISFEAVKKIETEKAKFHPSEEKIAVYEALANNKYSVLASGDAEFQKACADSGISWSAYNTIIKKMCSEITEKVYFKRYLEIKEPSIRDAVTLFRNVYRAEIEDNEPLCDLLEQECIWWSDDISYVLDYLMRRMGYFAKNGKIEWQEAFLDDDLIQFAKKLVGVTLLNYDDFVELIEGHTSNWDVSRVVLSDILLVAMGIAEAETFESIPLKVTMNEYVEISKWYSTPKSRVFVNGLLDVILKELYANGRIIKDERGRKTE